MQSTPWRTDIFTLSDERAWLATFRPCALATSMKAASSVSVSGVISARAEATNWSPETLIFSTSTPSRTHSRAIRRNSSGPSPTRPKLSW